MKIGTKVAVGVGVVGVVGAAIWMWRKRATRKRATKGAIIPVSTSRALLPNTPGTGNAQLFDGNPSDPLPKGWDRRFGTP